MNVKEGMRRLGLLLSVCGGILGACLAYGDTAKVWENHAAHRRFESLMASPTMQKVAKAARDLHSFGDDPIDEKRGESDGVTADPWEKAAAKYRKDSILVNLDSIKRVTVDQSGLIASIELSSGEPVPRVDPPPLKAYLSVLLYPLIGFVLPWVGVRLLTWVGRGFVESWR